jgi:hypothetical protein
MRSQIDDQSKLSRFIVWKYFYRKVLFEHHKESSYNICHQADSFNNFNNFNDLSLIFDGIAYYFMIMWHANFSYPLCTTYSPETFAMLYYKHMSWIIVLRARNDQVKGWNIQLQNIIYTQIEM